MLLNPAEILSFECPKCRELFKLEEGSIRYVRINGSITFGESKDFVTQGDTPARICVDCFMKLLKTYGGFNGQNTVLSSPGVVKPPTFRDKPDETPEFPGQKPPEIIYRSNTAVLGPGLGQIRR